jgi:hypothetical protein
MMSMKEYNHLLIVAMKAHGQASAISKWPIDEISLYFSAPDLFDAFVAEAKKHGDWIGEAKENQVATYLGSEDASAAYKTDYQFVLPHPESKWRIEAMLVTDGYSKLHESLASKAGEDPCVAHASFKTRTLAFYQDANVHLSTEQGFFQEAEYTNGYGAFSYYTVTDLDFFLKPRVNLRDAKES